MGETYKRATQLRQTVSELAQLQDLTTRELPVFTDDDARQLLGSEIALETVSLEEAMAQVPELTLEYIVPEEIIAKVFAASPSVFAGLDVSYGKGVPYVDVRDDAILAWEGPTELPDGRAIHLKSTYYQNRG